MQKLLIANNLKCHYYLAMNKNLTDEIIPRVGVGAAIIDNNQILLIQRVKSPEPMHWGLPGGKIDHFETAEKAIIREVKEETNLEVNSPFLLCISDLFSHDEAYHWLSPIYLFTDFNGTPKIQEPNKHLGIGWFDLNALPSPLTKATIDAIAALTEK